RHTRSKRDWSSDVCSSDLRDFAQVKGSGSIDTEIAQFALEALNIDKYGLDEIDNKILCTIIDKFKGGPVGLTTIATALGEDAGKIGRASCREREWSAGGAV